MNNPLIEKIIEKINIERDLLAIRFPLHTHSKEMNMINLVFDKVISIVKESD